LIADKVGVIKTRLSKAYTKQNFACLHCFQN